MSKKSQRGTRGRRYNRDTGKREYKPIFVISTEGSVTEPQYFKMFKVNIDKIILYVEGRNIKSTASDPKSVLKKMEKILDDLLKKKGPLKPKDQAWLVIDKDRWNERQIQHLYNWSKTKIEYRFALSDPNFEYWLLLHFEDPPGIETSRHCLNKLKRYLPNYKKKIDSAKLWPHIEEAIDRAKRQDSPPCNDWPRGTGTTVYKLVEELIKYQNL